jgi:predicted acylesterase/phospholipase RssA
MFGAWQVGAWRALSERFQPDLVVGASVGSLNGYAIAGGATAGDLSAFWLQPDLMQFRHLPVTIQTLMRRYPLRSDFAVVLTDLLRLKPKIFRGDEVTWRHLAASCAIPLVLPHYRIGKRWYTDGGLLNSLPVSAAVELGATHIVALHVLYHGVPSTLLKPSVKFIRWVGGQNRPLPPGVELILVKPEEPLGSVRDALYWRRENIERWLDLGYRAAQNISLPNCIER